MNSARIPVRWCHTGLSFALMFCALTNAASATDVMLAAQQNALVKKYCAVCHTDAAKNGGLSLQHFDAAQAPPSLIAMMLSKITGGVSLDKVRAVGTNQAAAALVETKMRSGAMGAAGIPGPDKATIDALIHAFATESAGASEWNVEHPDNGPGETPPIIVSKVQEAPVAADGSEAQLYRLIVSCNSPTNEGYVQLAWSPLPRTGPFSASVDGKPALQYRAEGRERMGNGTDVLSDPAAAMLAETRLGSRPTGFRLPAESLTVRGLFPNQSVTFRFVDLPGDARQKLRACFPESESPRSTARSNLQADQ